MGVAYRGQIPLKNIHVTLEVLERGSSGNKFFGVKQNVFLTGSFSGPEMKRLERTIDYCPRGQEFTKRSIEFEDDIHNASDPGVPQQSAVGASFTTATSVLVPGTVEAQYLPETLEASKDHLNEGEVKLYFTCETPTRRMLWSAISGHTSGWVPMPLHLTNGGLAASIVGTISQLVAPRELFLTDLEVRIEAHSRSSAGGRAAVQAAAESGKKRTQRLIRKISLGGGLRTIPHETIRAALESDPLSLYYRKGNILLDKNIVTTNPS